MSPKSNKSGVSYDEQDPRGNVPAAPGHGPVRVTRATDREAAEAGLRADDEIETADQQLVGEEGDALPPAPDNYEDKVAWSYQALQEESRRRWPDVAVNAVSRDDLVARLREDDANESPQGS